MASLSEAAQGGTPVSGALLSAADVSRVVDRMAHQLIERAAASSNRFANVRTVSSLRCWAERSDGLKASPRSSESSSAYIDPTSEGFSPKRARIELNFLARMILSSAGEKRANRLRRSMMG